MDLVPLIRSQGFNFLETALQDDALFYELYAQLNTASGNPILNDTLVEMLVAEGHRLLELKKAGKNVPSQLLLWIKTPEHARRLRDLMLTPQGMHILLRVAANASGEFLLFEPMARDYPTAHAFVNTLLVNKEGRALVIGMVDAACGNEVERILVPEFPKAKKSRKGERFHTYFSSEKGINEFAQWIAKDHGIEQTLAFLEKNESEACALLKKAFSNEKIVDALVRFLLTDPGRTLCAAIGKSGFGRKIGAGYLWLTPGGRALVKKLLSSFDGHECVYAIMTGMTRAEFIAGTVELK